MAAAILFSRFLRAKFVHLRDQTIRRDASREGSLAHTNMHSLTHATRQAITQVEINHIRPARDSESE